MHMWDCLCVRMAVRVRVRTRVVHVLQHDVRVLRELGSMARREQRRPLSLSVRARHVHESIMVVLPMIVVVVLLVVVVVLIHSQRRRVQMAVCVPKRGATFRPSCDTRGSCGAWRARLRGRVRHGVTASARRGASARALRRQCTAARSSWKMLLTVTWAPDEEATLAP